jgi:DNA polymerase V
VGSCYLRDSAGVTMKRIFLVDCNNFFVSCEQLFNPRLVGKPVVVLSNNDGCVVSRSQEAKKLGIAMGIPLFKIAALVKQHDVHLRALCLLLLSMLQI